MKKTIIKRIAVSVVIHIVAALIFVISGSLITHSTFTVKYIDDSVTYETGSIFGGSKYMDESEIHTQIYTRQMQDIITLCALKNTLEKSGPDFSSGSVNVLDYIYGIYGGYGSSFGMEPVKFSIDNLIKWGRKGFTYSDIVFSEEEFLGFYDSVYSIDELLIYCPNMLSFQVADDGERYITVKFLDIEYPTDDGSLYLANYANDWVEFNDIQDCIVYAGTKFSQYYDMYRNGILLYDNHKINLKYVIKSADSVYTNIPKTVYDCENASDAELTDFFSENSDYLIYYPEELEYSTISEVSESELYITIRTYEEDLGSPVKIWSYVDDDFSIEDDAFSLAYNYGDGRKGGLGRSIAIIAILSSVYIAATFLMAKSAGYVKNFGFYEFAYDKPFIEIYLLLTVGFIAISTWYFRRTNVSSERLFYPLIIILGILTSHALQSFINSFARDIRNHHIKERSIIFRIFKFYADVRDNVETSKNPYISVLVPFNFYLIVNFAFFVFFMIMQNRSRYFWAFTSVIVLIVINVFFAARSIKKASDFSAIYEGVRRIGSGELDYKIDTDKMLDINKDFADEINNIGEGILSAVNTSMRDEKMKSDLITNVSHDLKTPLTSIINYVNLLEDENITQEPAAGYIRTLDEKATRLKQLLMDLIDASRLSSGTTEVNLQQIRISELINQIVAEFSDKLAERNLTVIFDGRSDSCIMADGRHMWRLMDNLFENVCKYSLIGTRVYVEVKDITASGEYASDEQSKDKLLISIKNVSATPNKMQGNELTERFIRGDSSRTSEGSGLGLYIAKSLTELQGGSFEIIADGDLFKATMIFDISRS